jgi:hypothetical protein
MSRAKENRAFLEKCEKRACFLSESVLKYITVRRMSDTNASEKTDEKVTKVDWFFQEFQKIFKKVLDILTQTC